MARETITKQEAFNRVVRGLAGQGWERSTRHDQYTGIPTCCYRSADGKKCAAGHLLRDEDYRPEMDQRSVLASDEAMQMVLPMIEGEIRPRFIREMQETHDYCENPQNPQLKDRFRDLATRHCLEWPADVA